MFSSRTDEGRKLNVNLKKDHYDLHGGERFSKVSSGETTVQW